MMSAFCSVVRRSRAFCVFTAALLAASAAGWAADPVGDYGDAPDDATHFFPTKYATSNGRVGGPGINHSNVGWECLGTTVSAEAGAEDPADPDGVQNLVNSDGHDDGLIGMTFRPLAQQNYPFSGIQSGTSQVYATFVVTIPAGAPLGSRYLNVLMDTNRDQQWKNTAAGKEWVLINHRVNIDPGTSRTITVALDSITTSPPPRIADMWMRATLTRQPIDKMPFVSPVLLNGWDGSGSFEGGETEDYLVFSESDPNTPLIPPPPPGTCDCQFQVAANPSVLFLNHTQTGQLQLVITVKGDNCYATIENISVEDMNAPLMGDVNTISNYHEHGSPLVSEVGSPSSMGPFGPGVHVITVPVGPFQVHEASTQSFAVCFQVGGYNCFGDRVFGAVECPSVIVSHTGAGVLWATARLDFGPFKPINPILPIPIIPDPPAVDPVAYVTFGAQPETSGSIYAMVVKDYPPGLPPAQRAGMVKFCSFFDIYMEMSTDSAESRSQITEFQLCGWTDDDLLAAGIEGAEEADLKVGRYALYPGSFFDVFLEVSSHVGGGYSVDAVQNRIAISDPKGFSMYAVGAPGAAGVPVKLSSVSME